MKEVLKDWLSVDVYSVYGYLKKFLSEESDLFDEIFIEMIDLTLDKLRGLDEIIVDELEGSVRFSQMEILDLLSGNLRNFRDQINDRKYEININEKSIKDFVELVSKFKENIKFTVDGKELRDQKKLRRIIFRFVTIISDWINEAFDIYVKEDFKLLIEEKMFFCSKKYSVTKSSLSSTQIVTKFPQVFLSHAYEDRVYASGLIVKFLEYKVFLFADWLFYGEAKNGIKLKEILNMQLANSQQFLFLRTLRSELGIGGGQIKQWCSWEMGNFNAKRNGDEKFHTSMYGYRLTDNLMYDNFTELRTIINQKMV